MTKLLLCLLIFSESLYAQNTAEIRAVINVGKSSNLIIESSGVADAIKAPPIFAGDINTESFDSGFTFNSWNTYAGGGVGIPGYSTFSMSAKASAFGGYQARKTDNAIVRTSIEDFFLFELPDGSAPTQPFTVKVKYYTANQTRLPQAETGPYFKTQARAGFSYSLSLVARDPDSNSSSDSAYKNYGASTAYNAVTDAYVSYVVYDGNTGLLSEPVGILEVVVQPGDLLEFNYGAGLEADSGDYTAINTIAVPVEERETITSGSYTEASLTVRINIEEIISSENVQYVGSVSGINYQTDLLKTPLEPISIIDDKISLTLENSKASHYYRVMTTEDLTEAFVPIQGLADIQGTGDTVEILIPKSLFPTSKHFFKIEDLGTSAP
ncbi:MAG: hypothetical protein ACSHX0_03345 [Akkermansiaceae bacterium]